MIGMMMAMLMTMVMIVVMMSRFCHATMMLWS